MTDHEGTPVLPVQVPTVLWHLVVQVWHGQMIKDYIMGPLVPPIQQPLVCVYCGKQDQNCEEVITPMNCEAKGQAISCCFWIHNPMLI